MNLVSFHVPSRAADPFLNTCTTLTVFTPSVQTLYKIRILLQCVLPFLITTMGPFLDFDSLQACKQISRHWQVTVNSKIRCFKLDFAKHHVKGSPSLDLGWIPPKFTIKQQLSGMQSLVALKDLEVNDLHHNGDLLRLSQLTQLQSLKLCNSSEEISKVSDLSVLTNLTALRTLTLMGFQHLDFYKVAILQNLPIENLTLYRIDSIMGAGDIKTLSVFTKLESLTIGKCSLFDTTENEHLFKKITFYECRWFADTLE